MVRKDKTLSHKKIFTEQLLHWHHTVNDRQLPWKAHHDPYVIWLSEIILQQTQVVQGLPYFNKFIKAYPTIFDLANAPDDEVYQLWQGLGYYNRCRHMLATARHIATECSGVFPKTYEGLLNLKGIGPYTAAAIASFAFQLPIAVVDGNVLRVLSRFFGMQEPVDIPVGKKAITELAQSLLPTQEAAAYNQAIMDFGATVCKPKKAECDHCVLSATCWAYRNDHVDDIPIKVKRIQKKQRFFQVIFVIDKAGKSLWQKRTGKDIWHHLYTPLMVECESLDVWTHYQKEPLQCLQTHLKTQLTHQTIHFNVYKLETSKPSEFNDKGEWYTPKQLEKLAKPQPIVHFLNNLTYF